MLFISLAYHASSPTGHGRQRDRESGETPTAPVATTLPRSHLCAPAWDRPPRRHGVGLWLAELIGLGVGNVLCPFFGGIPATAAIARTATNIRAGAVSPLSAVFHAAFVLGCMIALAPLVSYLPMAALAGLLLYVAYNMAEVRHLISLVRRSPRSDVFVFAVCFALTIAFDMVIAIAVGVVLASLLFMRRMAELTQVELSGEAPDDFEVPDEILLYRIAGPLFFGAAQRAMRAMSIPRKARAVVVDTRAVPMIDATGLAALGSLIEQLERHGKKIVFCAVQPSVRKALAEAGIAKRAGKIAFAPDLEGAISIALVHAARPTKNSEDE